MSKVTTVALVNPFSALGKAQLANVYPVFLDLKATYESGSVFLLSNFREVLAEANYIAIEIVLIQLNSAEVYVKDF